MRLSVQKYVMGAAWLRVIHQAFSMAQAQHVSFDLNIAG